MTAISAIRGGLRATRRARWMTWLFFACNLVLAAALAAPMHSAIADHVGRSFVGNELARGFSGAWLTEFQITYSAFLKGFSIAVVYGGVIFLLLNAVLSAGAFEVFFRGEGAGMHAFGRGIGKFWGRFLRLTAVASVAYFAAFWFWTGPAARLLRYAFSDSVREAQHFYLTGLRWALLFFCVFVISAMVEYARADVLRDDHPSALAALGHGAGFVFARFPRVMAIYLGLGFLAFVTAFLYAAFARYFPQSSVLTVLIWFLVAQAVLWVRWKLRLASWAAAVAYYQAHGPRVATVPASGN
ncbi:MAG TPA: hypothetical protein VGX03_29870 [Candidatus Binatia bacterium]|nr:hypothetical protein [Candidatus Binatia bacterium]